MERIQKARIPINTWTVNAKSNPMGNATQNQYFPKFFGSMAQ